MKLTLILIISSFLFLPANAQSDYREDFKESCLTSKYAGPTERLSEITGYDFSQILQFDRYNSDLLIRGYIGSNYQRIQVHFISVIKNPDLPAQYFVYGKTKVNNNICDFQGTIKLLNARYYKESDLDTIRQGFLLAEYKFFEDPKQSHTGYFAGFVKSNWYITDQGFLCYDDLSTVADGYSNNEFVGIWNSYQNDAPKVCHWAHGRIPYSRYFDVGAGEFYPDDQYHQYGWDEYLKEYNDYINEKKSLEWWK